jgi:hypothetical protein
VRLTAPDGRGSDVFGTATVRERIGYTESVSKFDLQVRPH